MQHFLYQIKKILRSPMVLFWSISFPLILGTLFYFMFSSLNEASLFSRIPVGVVGEMEEPYFMEMLKGAETGEGKAMFEVTAYERESQAQKALKQDKIEGYILIADEDFELVVKDSTVSASIIKVFLDQYKQNRALIERAAAHNPEKIQDLVMAMLKGGEVEIEDIPLKGQDKDPYNQYFYALLAMACLMAAEVGVQNGLSIQADLSPLGARRNASPKGKISQVVSDFLATLFIYCVLMAGILAVLVYVFHRDFGSSKGLIFLGVCAGCFTGLAAGTMIAVVFRGSPRAKDAISVAFYMASSFLGGLQWVKITYYLEETCPIVNRINPATLIVNAFKSLAIFGDVRQYWINVATLVGIGLLFIAVSIVKLGRTKYASI